MERRFPGALEGGAIGNRPEVPVAVDLAVFVGTGSKPLLFGDPALKLLDVSAWPSFRILILAAGCGGLATFHPHLARVFFR